MNSIEYRWEQELAVSPVKPEQGEVWMEAVDKRISTNRGRPIHPFIPAAATAGAILLAGGVFLTAGNRAGTPSGQGAGGGHTVHAPVASNPGKEPAGSSVHAEGPLQAEPSAAASKPSPDEASASASPSSSTSAPSPSQGPVTIMDRMLNTMDYFHNVKGSYHYVDRKIDMDETLEFEIDEDQPGSYVQTTNNRTSDSQVQIYDGMKLLMGSKLEEHLASRFVKMPEGPRYYKGENGNYWNYRWDAAWAENVEAVFPQYFAFWTVDTTTMRPAYEEKGTDTLLGRKVVILGGKLDSNMGGKHGASTYEYWVDQETGVMMKMILTDDKGQEASKLEMISIEYDKGVDRSKFMIPPQ